MLTVMVAFLDLSRAFTTYPPKLAFKRSETEPVKCDSLLKYSSTHFPSELLLFFFK